MTNRRPSKTSSAASPSSSGSTRTGRSSSTATSTRSVPARSELGPPPRTEIASLGRPLFLLNLKTYPGALGSGAERFGRLLEETGKELGVAVAIAPAAPDLGRLASALSIPVIAQHVDAIGAGAHTGSVPPEAVAQVGGWGSLVNHSEHPIPEPLAAETVRRLRTLSLIAVVCARDVSAARRLATSTPPYLAVEPPELIGGDRSVSTARPGRRQRLGRRGSQGLALDHRTVWRGYSRAARRRPSARTRSRGGAGSERGRPGAGPPRVVARALGRILGIIR